MKKIPIRNIRPTAKEQTSTERFNIRDIKTLLDGKELTQELHRHNFFLILALKDGQGNHEIDFVPHDVVDNVVFCLRPGQVHQLKLAAACTGYLMEFNREYYQPGDKISSLRLRKASNKNACQLIDKRFEKLLSVLTYIFQEYTSKEEGYNDIIKASLDIFFIEFVRQSQHPDSLATDVNPYVQQRLDEFLELLETHIISRKQVSDYTDLMNLSSYQLNEITKTAIGKSPSEIINEHIILEAKRYLLATTNQVKEIADQLGYEDVSYFIRFFKKHTDFSPDAFRHNLV